MMLVLLWLGPLVAVAAASEVNVQTDLGVIIGEATQLPLAGNTTQQIPVHLFRGIPYAQARDHDPNP